MQNFIKQKNLYKREKHTPHQIYKKYENIFIKRMSLCYQLTPNLYFDKSAIGFIANVCLRAFDKICFEKLDYQNNRSLQKCFIN